MKSSQPYDVLIIGAGLSGLSAGIRLAHFGKKVAILERHDRVGGLNSYYQLNGHQLDVGLHALTNFNPLPRTTQAIKRVAKQLRIKWADLNIVPQKKSCINFPSVQLEFSNEFDLLTSEIERAFPSEVDGFLQLAEAVENCPVFDHTVPWQSTRQVMATFIKEPLLIEMLLCPLQYYGCPDENDMDFRSFSIIFLSILREGIGRLEGGVRPMMELLTKRFTESGGELFLESGVKEMTAENGLLKSLTLYDGRVLKAERYLSTIGHPETVNLCQSAAVDGNIPPAGQLSFMETLAITDKPIVEMGLPYGIVFFSNRDEFLFRNPDSPVDTGSGVICVPENFDWQKKQTTHLARLTSLANHSHWMNIDPLKNLQQKKFWSGKAVNDISHILPNLKQHTIFEDIFTPRSVNRYTARINGAVYGSPIKLGSGKTGLKNLFIAGTGQGLVGIVGTMFSGITMANEHLLR